ncbi:hypothetical protein ACIPVK_10330 [Paeniglutamicibacter sp. MACA_103]|uniref:hypothetical protein n=1 Tax=Paeniglutamicibacter sp. MACA_103 TaxID=3377337 RepID=UPI0038965B84
MEHRDNDTTDAAEAPRVAAGDRSPEPEDEATPSAEQEVKPGINQDRSTTGAFSSEPDEEASGTD